MRSPHFFDAHLDLAYLAEMGRDMLADPPDDAEHPAALTLKSLTQSHIQRAVATVFVQPRGPDDSGFMVDGPWCYSSPDEAYQSSLRQINRYHQWHSAGLVNLAALAERHCPPRLELLLLLEGAAGIRTLDDLTEFHSRGIAILGLTWVNATRWSGGDQSGGDVTADGRRLLEHADNLAMVHDVSHLSEQAFWSVLAHARRPKIASHSNCRRLLPGKKHPERHLSDQQILALANADGVIGINLFSKFLVSTGSAVITDAVKHIEHMVQLTGRTDIVGLGSDMDGGLSALDLPAGIRRPADLVKLCDALAAANFTDGQIEQFAWRNWNQFFTRAGLLAR